MLDGYTGTLSRVRYEYVADGRFAAVVWTNRGESTGYRADYANLAGSGLLAALTNSSGLTWTRGYEAHRDLLTAVENRNGTNLLSRYDYVNDALGRRTARLDSFEFPVSSFVQNSFDYNERSELISAQMGTNVYAYDFDPIGNRRSASRLEAAAAMTNLYASNPLNQYTNILCASAPLRETAPTYDADGNMLTNGVWSYVWDAENRLSEVRINGQVYSTFAYDHQSRLVDVRNWYKFTYDGWNLVRRGQQDQMETYVWGLDLSGSLQGAGGIGGLLSMSGYWWEDDGSRAEARVTAHYGYDGNGNVTDLTGRYFDQPEATVHYDYDPFGRRRNSSFTQPFGDFNFFGFSTKFAEYYTPGLLYYGYRWFDPELGRWLSRDPIGEETGSSLYCYVSNRTMCHFDFLGMLIYTEHPSGVNFYTPSERGTLDAPPYLPDDGGYLEYPGEAMAVTAAEQLRFFPWRDPNKPRGAEFVIYRRDTTMQGAVSGGIWIFGAHVGSMKVCRINIYLWVEYTAGIETATQAIPGQMLLYRPHSDSDGIVDNISGLKPLAQPGKSAVVPFGVVMAHETGHARGYFQNLERIRSGMAALIGTTVSSWQHVVNTYLGLVDQAAVRNDIDREANIATRAWFGSGWRPATIPQQFQEVGYSDAWQAQ